MLVTWRAGAGIMPPNPRLDKNFSIAIGRVVRTPILVVVIGIVTIGACARGARSDVESADKRTPIDLTQNVTAERKTQDKTFIGFEKNWRQFISASPQLARPVVAARGGTPWEPHVTSECVFSADAGGAVPQVTIEWSEDQQTEPLLRFDLAIVHDGFARNQYTSAIPAAKFDRFLLPRTSALISNQDAVLLTGPGLFPKIVDFKVQPLHDPTTSRMVAVHRLVLRDLSPGLTYTLRIDHESATEWMERGRYSFLTPVCPKGR
jgi:hypothetical protein